MHSICGMDLTEVKTHCRTLTWFHNTASPAAYTCTSYSVVSSPSSWPARFTATDPFMGPTRWLVQLRRQEMSCHRTDEWHRKAFARCTCHENFSPLCGVLLMINIVNFVRPCKMPFCFSRMTADWLSLLAYHEKSKWWIWLSHPTHMAYSVINSKLTQRMCCSMVTHVIHKCEWPPKQRPQPR